MKINYKVLAIGLLAFPAICLLTWTTFSASQRLKNTADQTSHNYRLLTAITQVSATMTAIESAMQSYRVTGDRRFTERTIKTASFLPLQIETARLLTSNNMKQHQNVIRLKNGLDKRVTSHLALIQAPSLAPVPAPLMTGADDTLPDPIKQLISAITIQEERQIKINIAESNEASRTELNGILGGGLVYIIASGILLFQLNTASRRRKIAQSQILFSEAKYRLLLEDAGMALFTTDLSGRFTAISKAMKSLTGYRPEELLHKEISFLATPVFTSLVSAHFSQQCKSRKAESSIEFPIFTKTGEQKWIRQHSILQHEAGRIAGFQCIVKDIESAGKEEKIVRKKPTKHKTIAGNAQQSSQWGIAKPNWQLPFIEQSLHKVLRLGNL